MLNVEVHLRIYTYEALKLISEAIYGSATLRKKGMLEQKDDREVVFGVFSAYEGRVNSPEPEKVIPMIVRRLGFVIKEIKEQYEHPVSSSDRYLNFASQQMQRAEKLSIIRDYLDDKNLAIQKWGEKLKKLVGSPATPFVEEQLRILKAKRDRIYNEFSEKLEEARNRLILERDAEVEKIQTQIDALRTQDPV